MPGYSLYKLLKTVSSWSTHPAQEKLEGFALLAPGWHLGAGDRISDSVIAQARQVLQRGIESRLDANVFPGVGGEVSVAFYHGSEYVEAIVNPDGRIALIYEQDRTDPAGEVEYEADASLDDVADKLSTWEAPPAWSLQESSAPNTTLIPLDDISRTWRSGLANLIRPTPATGATYPL